MMIGSEIDGSQGFKSSPLRQPVSLLRSSPETRRKFPRSRSFLHAQGDRRSAHFRELLICSKRFSGLALHWSCHRRG